MPFKSSARGAYGPQGQKVIKGPLAPVWVTGAGQVGSANLGASVSIQLSATDDSGDAPTYTIASGSLPTGLSLSSSGLISGTLGGSAGTATFTVNATDVNGLATTSGSFTFLSISPAWSDVTVTASGAVQTGGSSSISYTGSAPTYSVSGGIYSLTIPLTGTYRVRARGARGGVGVDNSAGGAGASIQGDFSFTAGQVIKLLPGNQGLTRGSGGGSGGGGGGSFVTNSSNGALCIAGGGGGGADGSSGGNRTGTPGTTGTSGTSGRDGQNSGGSGGNGGSTSGSDWFGSGGGGLNGNGANGGNGSTGGQAFVNGGNGGNAGGSYGAAGGFGGGGGATWGAAGGGGYSGGAGDYSVGSGSDKEGGGGGGSFNGGTNQSNTTGGNPNAAGDILITRL